MLSPLAPPYYINLRQDLLGWVVWFVFCGSIIYGVWRAHKGDILWGKKQWALLILFAGMVIVTAPFLGVRVTLGSVLPRPDRPEIPVGPALMFFAAVPWFLAGGLLGVVPATILGFLSGLLSGYLDSHNIFTPLEIAALAFLGSLLLRQNFRTLFFRFLRHPFIAALVLLVLYIPIALISLIFTTPGLPVSRVDYAVTNLPAYFLVMSGELLIVGFITEGLAFAMPERWFRRERLVFSPTETRLQVRFFAGVTPWVVILILIVMAGDWFVSEQAARDMLKTQLGSTARVVAEEVPFFLETGQNLIAEFAANKQLASFPQNGMADILKQQLGAVSFFRQLVVMDGAGGILAGYPDQISSQDLSQGEQTGISLALKGVEVQTYSDPPAPDSNAAQVAFIATIKNSTGEVKGVLLGRADLASNPFTQPAIKALDEITPLQGEGQIIDENGKILYHPLSSQIMEDYQGRIPSDQEFFDETGPNGLRQFVYYQPTVGRSWAVILTVPAQEVQQQALNTAMPLLVMILLFAGVVYLSLFLVLHKVTRSLVVLAGEAGLIAQGQLELPLPVNSDVDEVGQLSKAFEQMRLSLKARLDELNGLLKVSQGVASSLIIGDAIQPVLQVALRNGACLARVVLIEESMTDVFSNNTNQFSLGPASEEFKPFDAEILTLTRQRGMLVINYLSRGRGFNVPRNIPRPGALIALPLRHESQFYGALWTAYPEAHTFSEEEIRLLSTLAAEAGLAAANTRLYETAEIGRQRLEAVLVATPDPILMTDQENRILIANPAFFQLPGLATNSAQGQPIQEVFDQPDLLDFIRQSVDNEQSREIRLSNGRIYYITTSAVEVDNQNVGRIFILRDITHYKELDTLKSDFVATVSHDLRSPLTLMRGYATMLPLVGELNEQQKTFVRRIVSGIETMSRLVGNVLDLGHIEAGIGLKLEMIAPVEVLEHVNGMLQLQAAQKNIKFELTVPTGQNPVINVDAALLQQALYNLVENAIKYTPIGGQVKVSLQLRTSTVLFTVQDTGIGIAPIDQPRLFEKFFRGGQREAHQQRGSGLGLAIVKSIAEKHGGKVWLESQLGKGSTFYLEIPMNAQDAVDHAATNRG